MKSKPKMNPQDVAPPQPEVEYVIQVLNEELQTKEQNRLYLLAVIKQQRAEFLQAQEMWGMERESILASRNDVVSDSDATSAE